MSKKIIRSFLITIFLSLFFLSTLFFLVSNIERVNQTDSELSRLNSFLASYIEKEDTKDIDFEIFDMMDKDIRVSYISGEGKVLFDSEKEVSFGNHKEREEIIKANKDTSGFSRRKSESLGIKMDYKALKLENGNYIRTAIKSEKSYLYENIGFYIVPWILVIAFVSYLVSKKIADSIIEPILEMTYATERIASGEYTKRVSLRKEEELLRLGKNFNNMAESLQNAFKDSDERQSRLEAIMKSMNSGVFAYDNNNEIILINPFFRDIFGIYHEVIGKNIYNVKEMKPIIESMTSDKEMVEVRIKKPLTKDIRIRSADIFGEGYTKVGTVVVLQDITDLKKLEKMRSQFVANVSHELKTPLTSIMGFTETLKYVEDEKTRNKFLDIINEESERLTRLINDILTLSAIEQPKDTSLDEMIDVSYETRRLFNMIKPRAKEKNIDFIYNIEEGINTFGDKDNFKQLAINLMDNAVKYTKENGKIEIDLYKKDKSQFIFKVKDTGVGISKKHLNRIFERFYRVDKARDRVMGGTGLGLAIVKHIVLSFNGTIETESIENKGTTFIVTIPIKDKNYNLI